MNAYKEFENIILNQLEKSDKNFLKLNEDDFKTKEAYEIYFNNFFTSLFNKNGENWILSIPFKGLKKGETSSFKGIINYKILDKIIRDYKKISNKDDMIRNPPFMIMTLILFLISLVKEDISKDMYSNLPSIFAIEQEKSILLKENYLLNKTDKERYLNTKYNKALENIYSLTNGEIFLKGDEYIINYIKNNIIGYERIYDYITNTSRKFNESCFKSNHSRKKMFFKTNLYDYNDIDVELFLLEWDEYKEFANVMEYCKKRLENVFSSSINQNSIIEEPIELSQHNQKIMMMYELGIIDFLIEDQKLKSDNTIDFTKIGNIISSFTGIKLDSTRKTISAIYNKGEYGNNPYESKKGQPKKTNINKINAKFIQLDINKKKEY